MSLFIKPDRTRSCCYINVTQNKQGKSPGPGLERSDQLQGCAAAAAAAAHVNYINAASCLRASIGTSAEALLHSAAHTSRYSGNKRLLQCNTITVVTNFY